METLIITPYLNTRAFVHHGAPEGCRLLALPPSEAGEAIAGGRAVAGVVPVAGLARLAEAVEYLGAYGISCPGPAQSVLLFSNCPFKRIDASTRIRLSTDSMSSVRLLYLLLAYRFDARPLPRPVQPGEPTDGELVIGDAALRRVHDPAYEFVTDLADLWVRHHGLPMVFARWVIRRNAPRELRARLRLWLSAYRFREAGLLDRTALEDHARAGLTPARTRRYLAGIRTMLRAEDLSGQRRYLDELARRRWPDFLEMPPAPALRTVGA